MGAVIQACLSFNVTPRPTGFTGRIWCRRAIWSQRRHVVMSWCWWHWTCIRLPVLYEGRRTKSAIYCPSVLLAKAGERLQKLTVITHIWHLGCIQAKQTKTKNASEDGHHDARATHRRQLWQTWQTSRVRILCKLSCPLPSRTDRFL